MLHGTKYDIHQSCERGLIRPGETRSAAEQTGRSDHGVDEWQRRGGALCALHHRRNGIDEMAEWQVRTGQHGDAAVVYRGVLGPRSTTRSTAHGPCMAHDDDPRSSRLFLAFNRDKMDGIVACRDQYQFEDERKESLSDIPFPPFIIAANGLVLPGSRW